MMRMLKTAKRWRSATNNTSGDFTADDIGDVVYIFVYLERHLPMILNNICTT